jgi:hypothetical protein
MQRENTRLQETSISKKASKLDESAKYEMHYADACCNELLPAVLDAALMPLS